MPSSLIQLAQWELRHRVDKATDLSFFRNSDLLDFPEADPSAEVVDYGKKRKSVTLLCSAVFAYHYRRTVGATGTSTKPPYRNTIGMIKIATIFATLIIGLMAGPAVSLYGSPTVSPVTAA
jgi:hypothetical protein